MQECPVNTVQKVRDLVVTRNLFQKTQSKAVFRAPRTARQAVQPLLLNHTVMHPPVPSILFITRYKRGVAKLEGHGRLSVMCL